VKHVLLVMVFVGIPVSAPAADEGQPASSNARAGTTWFEICK
jgi:hypothetical protein